MTIHSSLFVVIVVCVCVFVAGCEYLVHLCRFLMDSAKTLILNNLASLYAADVTDSEARNFFFLKKITMFENLFIFLLINR